MTEDKPPTWHIIESDHLYFEIHPKKCSRCKQPLREDELPLILRRERVRDFYIYCGDCADGVVAPAETLLEGAANGRSP